MKGKQREGRRNGYGFPSVLEMGPHSNPPLSPTPVSEETKVKQDEEMEEASI